MSVSFVKTLPYNAKNERPSRVIFCDVESRVDYKNKAKQRFTLFLWTSRYVQYRRGKGDDTIVDTWGTDMDQFWDMVDSYSYSKTKLYVCTHHLEVDFMPLGGFPQLTKRGWKLDKLISHGRVLTLYFSNETRKLIILNNGNLFDGSIEQWGKVFGIPKLDMPDDKAPLSEWVTYCKRDTEIVSLMWSNLLDFMDQHDLGNFKLSKASLALTAYRHRFMLTKIAIHNNVKAILLERSSYKGGRFEALQIGDFTDDIFYSLDINSMYGFIMKEYPLPYELRGVKDKMSLTELVKRLDRYAVIARVKIRVDKPVLPHVIEGKIKYTAGEFITVLCSPELRYVLQFGEILEVYDVAWYYQGRILSDYASYFLDLKTQYDKEGNLPMRQVVKLYLNSLYGKFGQHGYEDKVIGECDPDRFEFVIGYDDTTKERFDIAYYGGKVHLTEETLSGNTTFTGIASHITAYGRQMLWYLIHKAGIENVYHVATDSLVVNSQGYHRLLDEIDASTPGKLKIEKSFTRYTVKDVNDTVQGETVKIKGIPKKADQLTREDFTDKEWGQLTSAKQAAILAGDVYSITEWPNLKTLLKIGIMDFYFTRKVDKQLHRPRYHATKGSPVPESDTDSTGRMK